MIMHDSIILKKTPETQMLPTEQVDCLGVKNYLKGNQMILC